MRRVNNHIEGDIVGKPILHLDDSLTERAKEELAKRIEYMDEFINEVRRLLSDRNIDHIVSHIDSLSALFNRYDNDMIGILRRSHAEKVKYASVNK